MASLQPAIRIGRNEGHNLRSRWRDDLDQDGNSRPGEPPQGAFLPAGDERADGVVVIDRRAGGREGEPPAGALATAAYRPRRRRPTAVAERRNDSRQPLNACLAELNAAGVADDTPLREEQLEHSTNLGAPSRAFAKKQSRLWNFRA